MVEAEEAPEIRVPTTFDEFYKREYRLMVSLAFGLTGSRPAAEEVAQEAFLRALRDWENVGGMESPGGWIRTVTMNLARSRWRRWRAEVAAVLRLASEPVRHDELPAAGGEGFWRHVGRLPRRQAQVVALHYVDDMTVAEIARVLGVAEGTVKATLHQARRSLSGRLQEEGWSDGVV